MEKITDLLACIREMAPEDLAEPWDNCGLIIASDNGYADRVAVCLDLTRAAAEEAIRAGARLIIAHHPLIFNPIRTIGADSDQASIIRMLIRSDVAVYAAHTNVDKTFGGLNDLLAGLIGLELDPPGESPANSPEHTEYYRIGYFAQGLTAQEFYDNALSRLKLQTLTVSPPNAVRGAHGTRGESRSDLPNALIKKVVVMCGSYSLEAAQIAALNADALFCGEIRHHEILELTGMGMHVVQAGHHGTERFFINLIEKWLKDRYPGIGIIGIGFSDPPTQIYGGGRAHNPV